MGVGMGVGVGVGMGTNVCAGVDAYVTMIIAAHEGRACDARTCSAAPPGMSGSKLPSKELTNW